MLPVSTNNVLEPSQAESSQRRRLLVLVVFCIICTIVFRASSTITSHLFFSAQTSKGSASQGDIITRPPSTVNPEQQDANKEHAGSNPQTADSKNIVLQSDIDKELFERFKLWMWRKGNEQQTVNRFPPIEIARSVTNIQHQKTSNIYLNNNVLRIPDITTNQCLNSDVKTFSASFPFRITSLTLNLYGALDWNIRRSSVTAMLLLMLPDIFAMQKLSSKVYRDVRTALSVSYEDSWTESSSQQCLDSIIFWNSSIIHSLLSGFSTIPVTGQEPTCLSWALLSLKSHNKPGLRNDVSTILVVSMIIDSIEVASSGSELDIHEFADFFIMASSVIFEIKKIQEKLQLASNVEMLPILILCDHITVLNSDVFRNLVFEKLGAIDSFSAVQEPIPIKTFPISEINVATDSRTITYDRIFCHGLHVIATSVVDDSHSTIFAALQMDPTQTSV